MACTNDRRSCSRKPLTSTAQPLSRRIATSRPSAGAAVEKFSRAVVAPHRAVTTVRCAGSAAPRCGSRRTCPTAARCSASSSPSAYASVRQSVRRNRSRGHRRDFRQIHADTAFGRHRWFAQGLRLGEDHQPDALQGRRGPRDVVTGSAHAIDATSARRRVLDRATWTVRRSRQHPTD